MPPRKFCDHPIYWMADPDCEVCREDYGHIPESPAFQGGRFKKYVLLFLSAITRGRWPTKEMLRGSQVR